MKSNKDIKTHMVEFDSGEMQRKKRTRKSKVKLAEGEYKKALKRIWKDCRSRIVAGIVVSTAAISVCIAVNQLGWRIGYEVFVDGENVGWVTEKKSVYDAIKDVNFYVKKHLGDDANYDKEPVFVRRIVLDDKLAPRDVLKANMLENVDSLVKGYAVYIDDKFAFGVSNEGSAKEILEQHKKSVVGETTDNMDIGFCEKTEIKNEYMSASSVKSVKSALDILAGKNQNLKTYIVESGDTLWGIAEETDLTVNEIVSLNEGVEENIDVGTVLKLEEPQPLLSVRCVQTVASVEPVPFEVKKINDNSIYEGENVIAQKGVEGSQKVLARVTTINGVEKDKRVLSSEKVIEPITQIEKIGTKERPLTTGSGTFINPTGGVLSSRYGQRWNRQHNGIDIAGEHNSDIKAADGGLVTYASWMSGYGNYVIINHENGYQTAYAHCQSLNVSVGERVAKGQVIAKMGSTGRSTGTHLHFEVKKNGVFVNPLDYVGY